MAQHLGLIQQASLNDAWLTIGTYDGVHIGHQGIIGGLAEGARVTGSPVVVVTFQPHPAAVIHQQGGPHLLTLPDERAEYLIKAGADFVITHPFTAQTAGTSAVEFLTLCKDHLGFRHLWVGYDFALGHKREGDINHLREWGRTLDYEVNVIPPVYLHGLIVSSSRIRGMLREGQVAQAAQGLGRWYKVSGEVVRGDGRGSTLGFPTANISVPADKYIPKSGVYACVAMVGGEKYAAAVNIGVRPTFDGSAATILIEAHLLNIQRSLYGQTVALHFVEWLREEKRFSRVHDLVEQIQQDVEHTRALVEATLSSKELL